MRNRKMFFVLVSLFLCLPLVFGFSSPKSKTTGGAAASTGGAAYPYLIDNFEDGDTVKAPEWFTFDGIEAKAEKNINKKKGAKNSLGAYSLGLTGSTNKWYVGGMGTMLGIDATKYKSLEMDIYGNGEGSGKLKIEFYDDDNGNNEIEVDSKWVPTRDDLLFVEIDVNWRGWKHISIPFGRLKLANKGYGNGAFDPNLKNGSGGLVKVQIICVANAEDGSVNYSIDNLELGN